MSCWSILCTRCAKEVSVWVSSISYILGKLWRRVLSFWFGSVSVWVFVCVCIVVSCCCFLKNVESSLMRLCVLRVLIFLFVYSIMILFSSTIVSLFVVFLWCYRFVFGGMCCSRYRGVVLCSICGL